MIDNIMFLNIIHTPAFPKSQKHSNRVGLRGFSSEISTACASGFMQNLVSDIGGSAAIFGGRTMNKTRIE
jgi:hypothetical protein